MTQFILVNGNQGYYNTYSLLQTDAPVHLDFLKDVEETYIPMNRHVSTGPRSMKNALEELGYKCVIITEESRKPLQSKFVTTFFGHVGNY